MATTGIVFNIQRYTIHDGPGIRTEVFLKGCPLSCKWCSNPESISPKREVGVYPSKCMGTSRCTACLRACTLGGAPLLFNPTDGKIGAIDRDACVGCMKCTDACHMHALKSWGEVKTVEDVMAEVRADRELYDNSGGGITISGGEPTVQWRFALELLQACRAEGIHTCLESCLQCSPDVLDELLPYVDFAIADLKTMDAQVHERWCGMGNQRILDNLRHVAASGVPLLIRTPMIPGVNDSEENIRAMAEFIVDDLGNNVVQVQLLPYLRLGEEKYHSLGLDYGMGEDYAVDDVKLRTKRHEELALIMREYGVKAYAGSTHAIED